MKRFLVLVCVMCLCGLAFGQDEDPAPVSPTEKVELSEAQTDALSKEILSVGFLQEQRARLITQAQLLEFQIRDASQRRDALKRKLLTEAGLSDELPQNWDLDQEGNLIRIRR